MGLTMAQQRQAPSQYKEESGDSVSFNFVCYCSSVIGVSFPLFFFFFVRFVSRLFPCFPPLPEVAGPSRAVPDAGLGDLEAGENNNHAICNVSRRSQTQSGSTVIAGGFLFHQQPGLR